MQDGQGKVGGGVLGGVWRTRLMPVVSHTTATPSMYKSLFCLGGGAMVYLPPWLATGITIKAI